MFKIEENPTFTTTVRLVMPGDDPVEQSFSATYRLLLMSDFENHDTLSPEGQTAFLQTIIVRLDDIVGADNEPIAYSEALRDQIIDIVPARNALYDAYTAALTAARVGN